MCVGVADLGGRHHTARALRARDRRPGAPVPTPGPAARGSGISLTAARSGAATIASAAKPGAAGRRPSSSAHQVLSTSSVSSVVRQVHWLTGRPGRIGLGLWVDARQRQRLIQLVAVDAVIVERVATTTMRQRQFCCRPDILLLNGADTTPGGVRGGGRATTRSARMPSTSNAAHNAAMRRNSLSPNTTSSTVARAAAIRGPAPRRRRHSVRRTHPGRLRRPSAGG